jgi:1,4-dihydroxy-2-naphthoate octaprenyltransferase
MAIFTTKRQEIWRGVCKIWVTARLGLYLLERLGWYILTDVAGAGYFEFGVYSGGKVPLGRQSLGHCFRP